MSAWACMEATPVPCLLPFSTQHRHATSLHHSLFHAGVSTQIRTWLDEEWTPLAVHAEVGEAAAKALIRMRLDGEVEMGSIVLGLGSELLSFNFRETFTGAFEVRAPMRP